MPTYDYGCAACGRRFEVVHGVHADGPATCPLCGKGPVRKVITAASVHYKGSGWAKKERRTTAASKVAEGVTSGSDDGSKSDAATSPDGEPAGSAPKKSDSPSTVSSGDGAPKTAEKASKSGAAKISD